MRQTKLLVALTGLALLAPVSPAQFTTSASGPIAAAGVQGDSGNGSLTNTYTGPNSLFDSMTFSGMLTSVISGTWASDATWSIRNTSRPSSVSYTPIPETQTFTISARVKSVPGLYWINQNDNFVFEATDTNDNGAGADANWSNVSFGYSASQTFQNLGSFNSGSSLIFDTEASDFNTKVALYSSTGTLIGTDDDGGTGQLSMFNASSLGVGDYMFTVGGTSSSFVSWYAMSGTETGNLNVNLNGQSIFAGEQDSNLKTFRFSVVNPVPEPASMAALLLGVVALVRRRSKKS